MRRNETFLDTIGACEDWDLIANARVVRVEDDAAWLAFGEPRESSIPLTDWEIDEKLPEVGDVVPILVEQNRGIDDRPLAIVRLVSRPSPRIVSSSEIISKVRLGSVHNGEVIRKIDDGYIVSIGHVNAFLPDGGDATVTLGQSINCRVVSIDEARRTILVSLE